MPASAVILDYNTVDLSERTLREVYLPPFKAAIDAGALSIMSAFNEIGGIPSRGPQCREADVGSDARRLRQFVQQREQDRTRAGADVGDAQRVDAGRRQGNPATIAVCDPSGFPLHRSGYPCRPDAC